MVWDPFRHKLLTDLPTPHRGNIFSVKFMPNRGDSILLTGAADSKIHAYDLEHRNSPIFTCKCHYMRVKRLATAPESPYVFWSSSEDGHILYVVH